jgi:DNA-binding transcriptional ArsR family regulator
MAYQSALTALADPTRRQVFEQLRSGPRAVGEIATRVPVSRPAVSQHLKVLKLAGLVADHAEGTRRVYCIDPHGLGVLRKYLDQFWDQALDAFQSEIETLSDTRAGATSRGKNDDSDHHRRARTQKRPRQRRSAPRL